MNSFRVSSVPHRKCLKVVKFIACGSCLAALLFFALSAFSCSNSNVSAFVAGLCESYKNGEVEGNLCPILCSQEASPDIQCQSQHSGKDIVFSVHWNTSKVIVKAKMFFGSDDTVYTSDRNEQRHYPDMHTFLDMVNAHFKYALHHNVTLTKDEIFTYGIPPTSAGMNTVFALLQQNEYILTWALQNTNTVPRIVGACGHAYAVEFVEPIGAIKPFGRRITAALGILKTLKSLGTVMDEKIQQCDMKMDHFGVDGEGNVKAIDLDALGLQSTIEMNIAAATSCGSHKDCDYFDCRGHCNSLGKCDAALLDDNIQVCFVLSFSL